MILLDVNVLVAAHREDAESHKAIRNWLETELASPTGVGVSELVLSGCLRVVTHPKVFRTPTPLAEALAFVDDLRSRSEVRNYEPGADHCLIDWEFVARPSATAAETWFRGGCA